MYLLGDVDIPFFAFAFAGVFLTAALPLASGFTVLVPVVFAPVPTCFFVTAAAFLAGAVVLPEAVCIFPCMATDFFTTNPVFLEVFRVCTIKILLAGLFSGRCSTDEQPALLENCKCSILYITDDANASIKSSAPTQPHKYATSRFRNGDEGSKRNPISGASDRCQISESTRPQNPDGSLYRDTLPSWPRHTNCLKVVPWSGM